MLCQHEAERLDVWAQPLGSKEKTSSRLKINSEKWTEHARTAFSVDPRIAFSLGARFPTNLSLKAELTQLVQKLVEGYLIRAAQRSDVFAHILIWHLQGENCAPEQGKEPVSAKTTAFLALLPLVRERIIDGFTPKAHGIFRREFDFFEKVTSISGVLYQLPKEERSAGIRRQSPLLMFTVHPTTDAGVDTYCESLGFENAAQYEAIPNFLCDNCKFQKHQCYKNRFKDCVIRRLS